MTAKRSDASLCQTLSSHLSDVNSVAFIDDCDAFVSCSGDKTVRLWRRHEGDVWQECDATPRPLSRHSYGVTSSSYCDATGLLAAASLDGKITIWDTKAGDYTVSLAYLTQPSLESNPRLLVFLVFLHAGLSSSSFEKRDGSNKGCRGEIACREV